MSRDLRDPRVEETHAALRGLLSAPELRGPALLGAIEAAGRAHAVEPFRACLALLSHEAGEEAEARAAVLAVEAHRTALETRLGRDPGFLVAAVDYLPTTGRSSGRPQARAAAPGGIAREAFDERLRLETRRAARTGRPVAVVLLAPDPPAPPEPLAVAAAEALRTAARDIDELVRLLPSGVAAILPCTSATEAARAARRLLPVAARASGGAWRAGVAAAPPGRCDAEALAGEARRALERARRRDGAAVEGASLERRRRPRRAAAGSVRGRVRLDDARPADDARGRREQEAVVLDLSMAGALVRLRAPLRRGDRVVLDLREACARPVSAALPARVVRAEGPASPDGPFRAALRFEPAAGRTFRLAEIVAGLRRRATGET